MSGDGDSNVRRTAEDAQDDNAATGAAAADPLHTPKLGGADGFDESAMETPRQYTEGDTRRTRPILAMSALSMTDSPRTSIDSPGTARPVVSSRKSSLATLTSKSPDLYEMASMYQPDEPTSLVVSDASGGYFQSINLATPTIERFDVLGGGMERYQDQSTNVTEWHTRSRTVHEPKAACDPPRRHRRIASEASIASIESAGAAGATRRASWYASAVPSGIANTQAETQPSEVDHDYNPRNSTSSSSLAESVGTAGEATDSEYEDQRSRSHSRQGSRRPSVANLPSLAGKRLSSFAPIADISRNSSQTNLTTNSREQPTHPKISTTPQASPPILNGHAQLSSSLSRSSNYGVSSSMVAVTSNQSTASSASSAKSSDIAQGPHIVNGKQMEIVGIGNKPENGPPPGKRKKQKPRVIDKVMSKTRPRDLPPKARDEDVSRDCRGRYAMANGHCLATSYEGIRRHASCLESSREEASGRSSTQNPGERAPSRSGFADVG